MGYKVDYLSHLKLFLGIFRDKVPIRKLINYTFVSSPKLMTARSKAPCSYHRNIAYSVPMSGIKPWPLYGTFIP